MATVTIQKRNNKNGISYVVTFKDPLTGQKKYYKTFQKYRIAQRKANDLRALLDSGKRPTPRKTKLTPLIFGEVSTSLEKEWVDRLARQDIAKKTFEEYSIWLNVLLRSFGRRILCEISAKEIKAFRNDRASTHSNITANKYLSVIKKVFKHGSGLNAVVSDPSEGVKFLSEKEHERNRFLLPHELNKLIEASYRTRAKFYLPAIIYLGAEHGASKQEILSLKWANIDFDYLGRGLIQLYRTKNRRVRTEFIMPRTRKALSAWRDHLKRMRHRRKIIRIKTDFVFCRLDGTPIKNFNRAWWRVLELAGITDFHFHDLRHTFCSNLILAGAGLKEVKEMIGHSDISMTDRYSHLNVGHKLAKQELLAEHYNNS